MNNQFQITDLLARDQVGYAEHLHEDPLLPPRQSKLMLSVNALKVCLASFCCAAAVASALAQTNGQFPVSTNVIGPTPTPQTSLSSRRKPSSRRRLPRLWCLPAPHQLRFRTVQCLCLCRSCLSPSFRTPKRSPSSSTCPFPHTVLGAAHETRRMAILASNHPAVAYSGADSFSYPHPRAISSIEVT